MLNFFFILSNNKFTRIDLNSITRVVVLKDHLQLHTTTQVHNTTLSIRKIKELLPAHQFTWVSDNVAIPARDSAPEQ